MSPNSAKIAIRPIESTDELRKAIRLMAEVHTQGDMTAQRWLEDCAPQYPGFQREHTRVAMRNHDVVSALRITTETLRIGEARLKMGGLGWVATAPHYRRKGVCRKLIEDAMRYMRDHNYHVSMLFGIANFYHRFGFVTSLADHSVLMDTDEALTFHSALKVSPAKPGETDALQRIHNANDGATACSLLRSAAHFHNKWAQWSEWYLLKDEQGRAFAYFIAKPEGDLLSVYEVGVTDRSYCAAVVRHAGELAEERDLTRIRFHVPPTHLFARFLTQFRTVHEMRVDRGAGGMMAFIQIGETLESMIPEWESQVQRSVLREAHTEFTVLVDSTPYRIRSHHGAIDVAKTAGKSKVAISKSDLIHLITGYRHPFDILDETQRLMTTEARMLFATIFPHRSPFVWRFDRF